MKTIIPSAKNHTLVTLIARLKEAEDNLWSIINSYGYKGSQTEIESAYKNANEYFKKYGFDILESEDEENKSAQIKRTSISTNEIKIYKSLESTDRDGYNNELIKQCCRGKLEHYKGYKWEYVEKDRDEE